MLRGLVGSSLRLRFLFVLIGVAILLAGVWQLRDMPVDLYPEITPPMVEIQTEALGLSAAEVESLITVPMEADLLNGVAWLEQIYSESVAGLSSIILIFEPGTDPIKARQMVQERLTQAFALPNVSEPPTMLQPLSTTNRVMMVGLSSDELSLIDLGVLARWNIKPRLMGVAGVANVAIWAQRERQLQVLVDPEQLHANGVTLDDVIASAGEALWASPLSFLKASTPGTAGWIDTPNQRLTLHHELPISSPEELAQVSVVEHTGLRLGDVAQIVEDHQPLIGDATLNDGPGLILVIEKFPGANTLEVTRGIEEAFDAMRPGLSGVEIDTTILRPATYLEVAMANLAQSLAIAVLLITLVLFLLYWNWRTTLISIFAIPLALVTAVFVLYLRGASFNALVLAGLVVALGAVIDEAIIDVENIAARLREQRAAGSTRSAASIIRDASLEMRGPITFAVLILVLVVLPILLMDGLAARFVQPLAVSYLLAIFASFVVALLITPAMSLIFLRNAPLERSQSPIIRGLQRMYNGTVQRIVQAPTMMLVAAVVLIVLGLAALPFLDRTLQPSFKQTELPIRFEGPPGTSREEMNRITARATQELKSIPGVLNVAAEVGRAITGDQVVAINSGELWVTLDPNADYDATVDAIHEVIDGYPGLLREVNTYQPAELQEALAGTDEDIVVRIYGYDFEVLRSKAQEVGEAVAGIDGVVGARADLLTEEPQLQIEVNLDAAEQNQIKPGDVRRAATTLLSGLRVGNLYEQQKVFDVVVWGVEDIRNSLTNISDLQIDTPSGELVRLGDVAEIRMASAPVTIKRDAVSRFVDVAVNVRGRSIAAVASDIKSRLQEIEFPIEFHAEVLSETTGAGGIPQRTLIFVIAAAIGVLLLLEASLRSWRLAFVSIFALLMALSGGVLAIMLDGRVLTLGAIFGFLAVFGIAVRQLLVLCRRVHYLTEQEGASTSAEVIMRAADDRLAPIVITVLATAVAMLPFMFYGNTAGHEIVRSMATVVLGGLVTTVLLNLFVMPAVFARFGTKAESDLVLSGLEPAPDLDLSRV
jgi:CzcA family heavy metal efflux pump